MSGHNSYRLIPTTPKKAEEGYSGIMASVTLLPTLLAITFPQWAFYIIYLILDPKADDSMPRRALKNEEMYAQAVERCRKEHKFVFLDLPVAVRHRIYSHLFNESVFLVCSFAKDRSLRARDDWPDTARAQILCTCKVILKEATKLMYWHTNWRFPSISSLDYFTWHDVSSSKLSAVAKITITHLEAVQNLDKIAHRMNSLRMLVVDVTFKIERFAPLPANQHSSFARRVKKTQLYRTAIERYTMDCIAPRCSLFVVVELVCKLQSGRSTREVCSISKIVMLLLLFANPFAFR